MSEERLISGFKARFRHLKPLLEKDWQFRRQWAAAEALALGRGGRAVVARVTGLSRTTIDVGIRELALLSKKRAANRPVVRSSPGRPRIDDDAEVLRALDRLIEPVGRGKQNALLRWSTKSTRRLAKELPKRHRACARSVAALLAEMGFTLQGRHKSRKAGADCDRDRQFRAVSNEVSRYAKCGWPVVVVGLKKPKTGAVSQSATTERLPTLRAAEGRLLDRHQTELERLIPERALNILDSRRWTKAIIDEATARVAIDGIRTWWSKFGRRRFKRKTLSLVADGVQSRQHAELQKAFEHLSKTLGVKLRLLFLPPGTCRWDGIAQQFIFVTTRFRHGCLKPTHQAVVTAIARRQTKAEPIVRVVLDDIWHVDR